MSITIRQIHVKKMELNSFRLMPIEKYVVSKLNIGIILSDETKGNGKI
ncbi:MAG: hypothetical protein GF353_22390 [Candidatus Lokiarchaeota archaeon]|nr:hypothetical protein [Candidatus Lokiarchaeota archaeon]